MRVTVRQYVYTILLDPDPDDGTYTVTVPALPGIGTQGATVQDAIAMAKDAIQCHIKGLAADGEPIPEEHQHPEMLTVSVAA